MVSPFPAYSYCTRTKPMRALEKLKASVSMKPQRRALELPNGEEFEFFMTPVTLAERQRAQRSAKTDDATDFALTLLCSKAVDENGTKLFGIGEAAELRNELPASLVEQIMLLMLQEAGEDGEDDEDPKPSTRRSRKTTG